MNMILPSRSFLFAHLVTGALVGLLLYLDFSTDTTGQAQAQTVPKPFGYGYGSIPIDTFLVG